MGKSINLCKTFYVFNHQQGGMMSKKIYVGNLSYNATEDSVREAFAQFGEILSVRLITDSTGRMKGFGFVEMASAQDAAKAIEALNGYSFMGRNIVVSEARPQAERGGSGGARRSHGKPFGRGREPGKWR